MRHLAPLAAVLLLSSCSFIPQYSRPAPPVPDAWPQTPGEAVTAQGMPAAEIGWQDYFTDAGLRAVIETALANNRDLRAAALAIEETAALYRIQDSALYPGAGVGASVQRYRVPASVSDGGKASTIEEDTVAVAVPEWELDLFGRLRSLKKAALEQYVATSEARSATQIALVGAVAVRYLALAADREQLSLARATLEAQRSTLELLRRSRELGVASDLDVSQAQSQVDAARLDVARYEGQAAVDRHALDVLAGATVDESLLPTGLAAVTGMRELEPGLPSEVLLRRPDVLAAEHRLIALNADIGAARAAFFPRITLTGTLGSTSGELSGLLGAGTGAWSFAAQIAAPLFAGGALRGNLEATRIERDRAVAAYEKAIQVAFGEVADALALRSTLAEQHDAQGSLVRALQQTYDLYEARYKAGFEGYLGVLVAQRALIRAQQGLIDVRLAEEANLVNLYKVLGGGGGQAPGTQRAEAQ